MRTVRVKKGDIALASHILLAIFENLRSQNNKRQLFMKVSYNDLQDIFYRALASHVQYLSGGPYFKYAHLKDLFVFPDSDPIAFSPTFQAAIAQLQHGGMICWPDSQEPDLMRLNPSATDYYETILLRYTDNRLAYQDIIAAQEFAKMISEQERWRKLIVDRSHLMNLPN